MRSAKVQTTIGGTTISTYTDSSGHYCLRYGAMFLPDTSSCILTYSKSLYTTEHYCAPIICNGVYHVPPQTLIYFHRWAVIVGIEKYQNSNYNIAGVGSSSDEWYDFVSGTLSFEHVIYLYNSQATESNIINALEDAISRLDTNDVFCFIFIGHGGFGLAESNNGNIEHHYFIYTYETAIHDNVYHHVITDDELASIIVPCKAEKIFLYLDACHSGGFHFTLEQLTNKEHIFFGAGAHAAGEAKMYKRYINGYYIAVRTCFTQCFLHEAWKEDFSSAVDAIFNNITSTFDLMDLTLEHYNEHVENGDYNFSDKERDQPIFYDWYTTASQYFQLSREYVTNPEE